MTLAESLFLRVTNTFLMLLDVAIKGVIETESPPWLYLGPSPGPSQEIYDSVFDPV